MQYLVRMTLVAPGRPTTADDAPIFIEEYILPTLDLCQKLQSEKRIIGGGPMSGAVGLVLLVHADSANCRGNRPPDYAQRAGASLRREQLHPHCRAPPSFVKRYF